VIQPESQADDRPVIRFQPGHHKRAESGHPWIYSNEILVDEAARAIAPGSLVRVERADGRPFALATFNPHALICARVLTLDTAVAIDAAFIAERVRRALALRERLYPGNAYRLIHAEADGLPGLIVDRFGDALCVQVNTAGMERMLPDVIEALERIVVPQTIILRNDSPARALEGLQQEVTAAKGGLNGPVEFRENGAAFRADLRGGQKTGWFFDQRDNRAWIASLANGKRVADFYCYGGGFAVSAALAGAQSVLAIDSSAPALALAADAAERNAVAARCTFRRGEAFGEMARLMHARETFDIVVADPPAFVKSRKDLNAGARGYRKLARLASLLVEPGGILFVASCSHHVGVELLGEQIRKGLHDSRREGRVLRISFAGADHPVHPHLPESAYLKAFTLQLD
jgi:23S rRNA (cytosine1962-C5)-methyltransferase